MSANYGSLSEAAIDAKRVVKLETNSVYAPALSTEDVAESLGIDVADAYDRLAEAEDASYIARKSVGDPEDPRHHVWW